MTLRPATPEELASSLRAAHASSARIDGVDLSGIRRTLEHTPEDLTVTADAGCTLAVLQQALATRGQWLPIDPPHSGQLTLAALLDSNASGPRRCGHGTIREHLIGMRVALADGRLIRSGGKVVKNVAGYDLLKLFIGAHGTLGVIVEATFKLLPLPEAEAFVQWPCPSLQAADARLAAILESELTPTVLDMHNTVPGSPPALVLGFSGARAAVDWQLGLAADLGFKLPAALDYDAALHPPTLPPPQRLAVLPSRLIETLASLGSTPYVARANNGVIHHRAAERQAPLQPGSAAAPGAGPALDRASLELMRRVKDTFDPRHVFAELSW